MYEFLIKQTYLLLLTRHITCMYIDLFLSFSVQSQYIVYRSVSQLFCLEPIYSIQICFLDFLFRANIQYMDLFLDFSVQRQYIVQICFLAFLFRVNTQYIDLFLNFSVQIQYIVHRSVSEPFCLKPIYSIQICFLAFLFRANKTETAELMRSKILLWTSYEPKNVYRTVIKNT